LKVKLEGAVFEHDKAKRDNNVRDLMVDMRKYLEEKKYEGKDLEAAIYLMDKQIDELVHHKALAADQRQDGRRMDQLRDLYAEAGVLRRAHGSAIFVRGNTQALAAVTIASPGSEQLVESMEGSSKRRFMLHYNFPPFSVGETGRVGAPGRRDIGHGRLAEKTIRPLIPEKENFPYTIRIVSEILSSNGSSSMATVCASCLALMDAGVPITKPAAGIAMGLMSDDAGNYKVLTDIQGPEDHHGDMDFKAAGTRDGVNAIQMDVKVHGVSLQIIRDTLAQAKKARFEILDVIEKVLSKPRPELSRLAPRVLMVEIDPSRIGELVGPGGKVINGLIASTGVASIDIEQDGKVFVASVLPEAAEKAIAAIRSMMRDFKVGEIIEGDVIKILEFGAIVDIGGGRDGMIHVSEIRNGFVKNVSDVLKLGDRVKAKIIKVENGKIGLSIKQLESSPSSDNH
jgi:polyribonucleotide nucleotidyltransferase